MRRSALSSGSHGANLGVTGQGFLNKILTERQLLTSQVVLISPQAAPPISMIWDVMPGEANSLIGGRLEWMTL